MKKFDVGDMAQAIATVGVIGGLGLAFVRGLNSEELTHLEEFKLQSYDGAVSCPGFHTHLL